MQTRIEYLEARKLRLAARLEGVEHDLRFERHRIEEREILRLRSDLDDATPLTVVKWGIDVLITEEALRGGRRPSLWRRIRRRLRRRRGDVLPVPVDEFLSFPDLDAPIDWDLL